MTWLDFGGALYECAFWMIIVTGIAAIGFSVKE
jgi:hypothetical protein